MRGSRLRPDVPAGALLDPLPLLPGEVGDDQGTASRSSWSRWAFSASCSAAASSARSARGTRTSPRALDERVDVDVLVLEVPQQVGLLGHAGHERGPHEFVLDGVVVVQHVEHERDL